MVATITDYLKEAIEGIKERVKNPFTERNKTPFSGAFVISLILYNWQLCYSLIAFDEKETRLAKIAAIEHYLQGEEWYCRILYPLAFAFGSIAFFYLFNNVSLAITTISNRWIKGTVLYLFDRGKTITREEYEKLANKAAYLKKQSEIKQTELDQAEENRNIIEKELTVLTKKYGELVSENDTIKKQINNPTGFNILYARYGAEGLYNDVTEKIDSQLLFDKTFTVENKFLSDPIRYSIKDLFILYQSEDEKYNLVVNEGEIVSLTNGRLVATETTISKRKQYLQQNIAKLAMFLAGEWILNFTATNGQSEYEKVIVDNTGKYFANSKHSFYLRTVDFDDENKTITLNKIDLNRNLHSKETLEIKSDELLIGTDSKGYRLEYRLKER